MHSAPNRTREQFGYCGHGPRQWQTHQQGRLLGQKIAVKDLFAVEGYRNSAGNPDWYNSHSTATATATAVQQLMAEGAVFNGFSHTDELAYSLEGNNAHYQATENPKLPGHACGGSTMGSAAAVASGDADIGLGTDTGGSIRVPASYCGLFGMRPSQGLVSTEGLIGLAPRFDTVGWLTQNAASLNKVGQCLLPKADAKSSSTLWIDSHLLDLLEIDRQPLMAEIIRNLSQRFSKVVETNFGFQSSFQELEEVFRVLQGRAVFNYHKEWLQHTQPKLSPAVAQRMTMAEAITDAEVRDAEFVRLGFTSRLLRQLKGEQTLLLPTTPSAAPKLYADTQQLRPRLLKLTAIAGLSGSPQIHLPLSTHLESAAVPMGFSLLQSPRRDLSLLKLAVELETDWAKGAL